MHLLPSRLHWLSPPQRWVPLFWVESGGWGLKNSKCGPLLFSILNNSRERNGQACSGTFAPRLAVITAHAPGQHMWLSQGSCPYSKCSKTVGFMFRFYVEVRLLLTRYKSVRVSALTGSVPRKMAEGAGSNRAVSFSTLLESNTLPDSLQLALTN